MKRRYIYGLFDSGTLRTISYVGCTGNPGQRYDQHLSEQDKTTRAWVKSVRADGGTVRMVILEAANGDALLRERWWIGYLNPKLNFIHREPRRHAPVIDGCEPGYLWEQKGQYFHFASDAATFFEAGSTTVRKALKAGIPFYSPRFDEEITLRDLTKESEPTPPEAK